MRDRLAIVVLALFAAALIVWHWVWVLWGSIVASWGDYSSAVEWLDPGMLLLWALLLALYMSLGASVVLMGRPARPLIVGTSTGALLGVVLVLQARNFFGPNAGPSVYIWHYGVYVLAPIGSLVGAFLALLLGRRLGRPAVADNAQNASRSRVVPRFGKIAAVGGAILTSALLGFVAAWQLAQAKLAVYQTANVDHFSTYVVIQRFKGTQKSYEVALKDFLTSLDVQEKAGPGLISTQMLSVDRALTYSRLATLADARGDTESAAGYRAAAEALCPKLGWQTCSAKEIAEMADHADRASVWAPATERSR